MLRKSQLSLAAFILTLGFGMISCSGDDKVPEEPVQAVPEELPATPPGGQLGGEPGEATKAIYFAFDDYTLSPSAQDSLNTLADYMKATGSAVVQIEGHCDERGSIEYNLALGERRAQSVKNYLVQLGIDPARLPTISYGEEKPIASGSNEAAWGQNRRAEFVVSTP